MQNSLLTNDSDTSPLLTRAELLCELGRHEEVLKLLMPVLDNLDPAVQGCRCCVFAMQSLKRHNDAVALVELALARHPGEPDLLIMYASVLGFVGMYKKALEQSELALALDPEDPQYHYFRAFNLHKLDQNRDALESAETAVELEPENVKYRTFLATLEYLLDNNKRAEVLINGVLQDDPRNVDALSLKGRMSKGLWQKICLFRQALSLSPTDQAQQGLYNLYARQFPRTLALNALLILAVALFGMFREHAAVSKFLDQSFMFGALAGFYLIKRTWHHVISFMVMFASVVIISNAWLGKFDVATIPGALLFAVIVGIVVLVAKYSLVDTVEELQERWRQLVNAFKCGRATDLLQEWIPARAAAASAALALLPTLFLFGVIYKTPPYLLFVMATAPLLYAAAGIASFKTCVMASCRFGVLSLLPLVFLAIMGIQDIGFRLQALLIMYVIALYLAHRYYRLSLKGD
jgi:hypothetical protein